MTGKWSWGGLQAVTAKRGGQTAPFLIKEPEATSDGRTQGSGTVVTSDSETSIPQQEMKSNGASPWPQAIKAGGNARADKRNRRRTTTGAAGATRRDTRAFPIPAVLLGPCCWAQQDGTTHQGRMVLEGPPHTHPSQPKPPATCPILPHDRRRSVLPSCSILSFML